MRAFAHRDPTAAKVLYEWFSSRIYGLAIVMLGTDEAGCGGPRSQFAQPAPGSRSCAVWADRRPCAWGDGIARGAATLVTFNRFRTPVLAPPRTSPAGELGRVSIASKDFDEWMHP
jgi:hypothetical protein